MMTTKAIKRIALAGAAIGIGLASVAPAAADWRGDQPDVIAPGGRGPLPLPVIERRVRPQMGGASYLGPEFDSRSGNYRLKFMNQGAVIWVDVDGHSGNIIRKSGR